MTVPALSEWRTACSVERRGAFLTTGNARKKGEKRAMRKNKMMRAASGLLVAVLLSTCAISGTFAKYTTSANGTDSARVAKWGFQSATVTLNDLFKSAYDVTTNPTVKSDDDADVIAPGTTNSGTFDFTYGGADINDDSKKDDAPEVAYKFTVSTEGSTIATDIEKNTNIQWKLDDGNWGTWDDMIAAIKNLSGAATGTQQYEPGQLPEAFKKAGANTHTVYWRWLFETSGNDMDAQDVKDTTMGNKETLDEVKLQITITATQID